MKHLNACQPCEEDLHICPVENASGSVFCFIQSKCDWYMFLKNIKYIKILQGLSTIKLEFVLKWPWLSFLDRQPLFPKTTTDTSYYISKGLQATNSSSRSKAPEKRLRLGHTVETSNLPHTFLEPSVLNTTTLQTAQRRLCWP